MLNLLLETHTDSLSGPWLSTDSELQFIHNSQRLGAEWAASWPLIDYQLNSQGYRAPEWSAISWSRSVIFFGCSQTFGLGLALSQSIPNLSSDHAVNLARPGASSQFIWANTQRLCLARIKPRAVVYIWPEPQRSTRFLGSRYCEHQGSWTTDSDHIWRESQDHWREYSYYLRISCHHAWSCPVLNYSWQPQVNCALLGPIEDRARDCQHLGPKTAEKVSQQIRRDLDCAV